MNRVFFGHCIDILQDLAAQGVRAQTCVTSPPYWGLRDYGTEPLEWPEVTFVPVAGLPSISIPAQRASLGLEADPWAFVAHMVLVFRAVRDCLQEDGTLWLNLGDKKRAQWSMTPAMVALALQGDGWFLQEEIIWEKTNAASVGDLRHVIHEHEPVYLFTKAANGHYFDRDALRQPHAAKSKTVRTLPAAGDDSAGSRFNSSLKERRLHEKGALGRSVWHIAAKAYKGAHSSVFPSELAERCIKAGSRPADIVLDPFFGSGTTGEVAERLGRQWIGCELQTAYEPLQRERTRQTGLCI